MTPAVFFQPTETLTKISITEMITIPSSLTKAINPSRVVFALVVPMAMSKSMLIAIKPAKIISAYLFYEDMLKFLGAALLLCYV